MWQRLFILLIAFWMATAASAQSETPTFPTDWVGDWAGTIDIYTPQGKAQSLPMQLRIHPLHSGYYTFHIIYGEDEEAGLRPYVLEPVDTTTGAWRIDEANSIAMEAYVRGAALYSRFEVGGTMLISIVAHEGETLRYEIVAGSTNPVSITGNTTLGDEEIPEVKTYPIPTAQVARLRRVE